MTAATVGELALVAARSSAEIALSIERREPNGGWKVVGTRRGLAPVAAWPAPADDKSVWRVVVWSVGGGDAPIAVAARAIERRGRNGAEIGLEPVADSPTPVCVGLATLPGAAAIEIAARAGGPIRRFVAGPAVA